MCLKWHFRHRKRHLFQLYYGCPMSALFPPTPPPYQRSIRPYLHDPFTGFVTLESGTDEFPDESRGG